MKKFFPFIRLTLAGIVLASCSWGCASSSEMQKLMRTQLEKQAEFEKVNNQVSVKPVQKTAEEYEKAGDSYLARGDEADAFIQYQNAIKMDSGRFSAHYRAGTVYLKKGMYSEARVEFETVLKNKKAPALKYHPAAFEGMGIICMSKGDLDSAKKNFSEALKLDPSMWRVHNLLGITFDRLGDYGKARIEFKKAIQLARPSGSLFNNLGISCLLQGDYESGVTAFNKALEFENDKTRRARICGNLALALCKLGRDNEAQAMFEKAGSEAQALNNMGYVYMMEKKYEKAIDLFRKAALADPAYYTLAHENLQRAIRLEEASSRTSR